MADKLTIKKYDEVYIKIVAEPGIIMELSEYFTFDVPGAKFMPSYRNKIWDGKIRLLNVMTGLLYAGLITYVESFASTRGYEVEYDGHFSSREFSLKEANDFIAGLKLPMVPHEHQLEAFVHAVRESRALLISPTASGKSLIIYLLTRFYASKTLIIVPTVSLVSQLATDFEDYGLPRAKDLIHKVTGGEEKYSNKPITISTWQSIYKMDKDYFDKFDLVIGDEAHLFKSKSLTTIMGKLTDCKYKFGLTGTLDGTQTHKLVLEGLFGAVRKVISTEELMKKKLVAQLTIKAIVLDYPDLIRKLVSVLDYPDEMDFLVTCQARNRFIKNLALSLEGNTMLLYQFVEKHGKILFEELKRENPERSIYYVSGAVGGDEREFIRKIVETETNAIIVASYGTFSTGTNIKNLHNLIFSSPSKSQVRNLQSIGRSLRISDIKSEATLFDIADDLTWKSKKNFTILHFMERVKIYNNEKFNYKIYKVSINP